MTIDLQAISNKPDWSEVYHLADTYRQQQQWQPAVIGFRRAIELRPDFFWSYHHLGDVLSKLQQWQPAAQAYSQAVKLDPNFFWSWHNLGDAFGKLQQWQPAVQAYTKAVKLDPNFFWSWHNLGDGMARLQQWDQAIAIYLQAIQLQPEHQQIYQKLGTVFKQRGALEQSIQHYRQLIRSPQPNYLVKHLKTQPQLLVDIAESLVQAHQTLGAIVLYYAVLEIAPNQTQILLRLNQLLEQHQQLQQTIAKSRANAQSELLNPQPGITPQTPLPDLPGKIAIASKAEVTPEQLANLFKTVGWSKRTPEKVKQSLAASFCYITVWYLQDDQKQLIGFARAISDGVFHAVLLDVLIHPQFQNRGWGTKLVKRLIEQLQHSGVQDITLFTSPHVMDFYHRLGFISQPNHLQLMVWSN